MSSAPTDLVGFFGQYITDNRKALIEKVLQQRTRHLTIVLEDIYQSQNASAAVRTCECMGIQDIHIVEKQSKYSVNRKVLMGSSKWVDLIRYKAKKVNNTEACFRHLKEQGYQIAATDPSGGTDLNDVPVDGKIALVMGNELKGLSSYALENSDFRVKIPMYGFTESFNISVSAAICISTLMRKIRDGNVNWHLTEQEVDDLRKEWYRKCIRNPEILEKTFLARKVSH